MQPAPNANILVVDDYPENLVVLEAILASLGQILVKATSGMEALRCLLNQDFAVILLDVQMPRMDGFETATLIRQRPRSQHTPIIFITAIDRSDSHVAKGYSLDAVDYLFKPLVQVLINLISNAIKFTEEGSVTCRVRKTENAIALSIIDSGIGIAETDQPQVFEQFRQIGNTLTDKPKSTGLGLPICKQIVEHHGGTMWVEVGGK